MKRILLMVLRNLWFVPYGWFKLCYTAVHVEKYTEEAYFIGAIPVAFLNCFEK